MKKHIILTAGLFFLAGTACAADNVRLKIVNTVNRQIVENYRLTISNSDTPGNFPGIPVEIEDKNSIELTPGRQYTAPADGFKPAGAGSEILKGSSREMRQP